MTPSTPRRDRATGADLLTYEEADRAREREAAALRSAEVRIAELEGRLRELENTPAPPDAPQPPPATRSPADRSS